MRAVEVELLAVADDAPVRRDLVAEHRELDEAAELADHVQALDHARRVPGRLDVDVAAVALGQRLDLAHDVLLERVHHEVRAEPARQLEPLRLGVEHDQLRRVLQPRRPHHAQAERPRAREHDHVVELDQAAVDRMHGARIRLDEHRLLHRQGVRDAVGATLLWEAHVPGHAAVDVALEAVDVVALAHPVLATAAVAAVLARHDLLRDQPVADLVGACARDVLAQLDRAADELVTRDHRRQHVAGLALVVAPERRRALERLDVAGADAAGLDLDDDVVRPGARHVHGLEPVVAGAVGDHRLHRGGQGVGTGRGCGLAHRRTSWGAGRRDGASVAGSFRLWCSRHRRPGSRP